MSRESNYLRANGWQLVREVKRGMFRSKWWKKNGTDTLFPQGQAVCAERVIQLARNMQAPGAVIQIAALGAAKEAR